MKTAIVTGDLMWNHYLIQHEPAPRAHDQATVSTVVERHFGGAWYTAELLRKACGDAMKETVDIRCAHLDGNVRPSAEYIVHDAYQICSQFAQTADDKKVRTWRIRDFLGCHLPDTAKQPLAVENDSPDPYLLLIDDVNLGFNESEALWPRALGGDGKPMHIVYKTSAFPNSKLWRKLYADFPDRMTVVIPADALRTKCAAISKALSWDQTIEDVVREFARGACTEELARCRRVIVHFGPAGAACLGRVPLHGVDTEEGLHAGNARLERFVYRPDELEGAWYDRNPGLTFGVSPIIAAAVARHDLDSSTYPLFIAIARALGAARLSHETGGGQDEEKYVPEKSLKDIALLYHPPVPEKGKPKSHDPADVYFSSFPHRLLTRPQLKDQLDGESDLLRDLTGATDEYVAAKAIEVVMWGPEKALDAAPKAKYGNYFTVDRQEIERINAVRNLMLTYHRDREDKRPLSIAVFGPPGSGKSFAIRELAGELLSGFRKPLEFNMSQFNSVTDLRHALHQVADATVRGETPLVFWDEFDATLNNERFFWLRHFLEPMQDGSFRSDATSHPLGKAIFVFAGGTCHKYEDFTHGGRAEVGEHEQARAGRWKDFEARKGPDFVSRLRGYVDIKGPNREERGECNAQNKERRHTLGGDSEFFIRRALLLRALLRKHHRHLLDGQPAPISPGIINAFLMIPKYLHGARSLEAIVSMSPVGSETFYGPAHVPPAHLLRMHTGGGFRELVREGALGFEVLEALAEACHEAWMAQKKRAGWEYGEKKDPTATPPTHNWLLEYSKLPPDGKEANRKSARVVRAKLLDVGLAVQRAEGPVEGGTVIQDIDGYTRQELYAIEHDIWMRDHLLKGYQWEAKANDDTLRLHQDLRPFSEVPTEDQKLDEVIIASILPTLTKYGYVLVRGTAGRPRTPERDQAAGTTELK